MEKTVNGIPRRCRLDLNTPAELAIYNAMQEVEKLGADPVLTNIVSVLATSKDLLSDFLESNPTP